MPVLSDRSILSLIDNEGVAFEPFDPGNLTPNGYDLTVGEVLIPEMSHDAERIEAGVAIIPGRERFLVSTAEVVTLGPAITGQLWIRSTYARKGIVAAFGKVEAGFSGTLTVGCFNASKRAIELPIGERFCQIALEALTDPAEALYAERSGTYQDQRGVTLPPEP